MQKKRQKKASPKNDFSPQFYAGWVKFEALAKECLDHGLDDCHQMMMKAVESVSLIVISLGMTDRFVTLPSFAKEYLNTLYLIAKGLLSRAKAKAKAEAE